MSLLLPDRCDGRMKPSLRRGGRARRLTAPHQTRHMGAMLIYKILRADEWDALRQREQTEGGAHRPGRRLHPFLHRRAGARNRGKAFRGRGRPRAGGDGDRPHGRRPEMGAVPRRRALSAFPRPAHPVSRGLGAATAAGFRGVTSFRTESHEPAGTGRPCACSGAPIQNAPMRSRSARCRRGLAPQPGLVTSDRLRTTPGRACHAQPDRPCRRVRQERRGACRAVPCRFRFCRGGRGHPRPQPGNPRPRLFRLAEDAARRSTASASTTTACTRSATGCAGRATWCWG